MADAVCAMCFKEYTSKFNWNSMTEDEAHLQNYVRRIMEMTWVLWCVYMVEVS